MVLAGIAKTNAERTECRQGHAFTPENTARRANGGRICIMCDRARRLRAGVVRRQGRPAWIADIEQRHLAAFFSRIQLAEFPFGGCWIWSGRLDASGYGLTSFRSNGSVRGAHRWAYLTAIGPIPDGLQIDHLCRTRACVNPLHMEVVTFEENMRRTRKEYCARGLHKMTPDNIPRTGRRRCATCAGYRLRPSEVAS